MFMLLNTISGSFKDFGPVIFMSGIFIPYHIFSLSQNDDHTEC